jgi:hypothetical protein
MPLTTLCCVRCGVTASGAAGSPLPQGWRAELAFRFDDAERRRFVVYFCSFRCAVVLATKTADRLAAEAEVAA